MKKIKWSLMGFIAVLMMIVSNKVFASDTYTVTLNGTTTGHTYEVYQIFSGDLSNSTLSNIKWGKGVSAAGQTALGDAVAKAESLDGKATDATEAQQFAKEVALYLQTPSATVVSTETTTIISGLSAGYYLIKDKEGTQNGTNDAYTRFILEVVKNTQAELKSDVPKIEKKVQSGDDYRDAASYAIGESIPYQLTATLPSNYESYKEYYLSFNDSLSSGLTYNNDAKVYVVNGSTEQEITNKFTIAADGSSYVVNDLKTVSEDDRGQTVNITKEVYKFVAESFEKAEIRNAVQKIVDYISYANKYYDSNEPWLRVKDNIDEFNKITYTCIYIMANLANLIYPILPKASKKIKEMLSFEDLKWEEEKLSGDYHIKNLDILYNRIEEKILK